MTVIFSKKCEYGLQAVLYLATLDTSTVVSSDEIARKLCIPKEFLSKILQSITKYGIVSSKKGKTGGFSLARIPKKIKLLDIVAAIDGLDIFNNCVIGFPKCNPENVCPLHEKWDILRSKTYEMLNEETIDNFKEKTMKKLETIFLIYNQTKLSDNHLSNTRSKIC